MLRSAVRSVELNCMINEHCTINYACRTVFYSSRAINAIIRIDRIHRRVRCAMAAHVAIPKLTYFARENATTT